jgi:hypothetical protein
MTRLRMSCRADSTGRDVEIVSNVIRWLVAGQLDAMVIVPCPTRVQPPEDVGQALAHVPSLIGALRRNAASNPPRR